MQLTPEDIGRRVYSTEKGFGTILFFTTSNSIYTVKFDNGLEGYYRYDGVLFGYDGYPDKNVTLCEEE